MHVLLTTDPIGGVWTFTRELATHLLDRGHAVALVSFGRALTREQNEAMSALKRQHFDLFRSVESVLPLEWMTNNQLAPGGAAVIEQVADVFAPDVFHTNQFCYGDLLPALPSLITAHSDVLSWAAACRPEGLAASRWLTYYREIVQQGLSSANAIAAPSQWMLNALRKNFQLPAVQKIILNGHDPSPIPHGGDRLLRAITCGRLWDEAKNLDLLRYVQTPIPVLVAGEIEHDSVSAVGDAGSASLIGSLSEQALMELFRKSAIYIVTSIYEPFGLAPLEAALEGCAIIANDIPSLREVWGDTPLYYQGTEQLSLQLTRLRDDGALLQRVQQRCHRRALGFTASRMTDQYLALYQDLLRSNTSQAVGGELITYGS